MPQTLILTGDVNLMSVTDPDAPFRHVAPQLTQADAVFSNLECCLYDPPDGQAMENEGFYALPGPAGEALKRSGIQAVGNANNVNYGEAAIRSSNTRLDEVGIPHCGSGMNRAEARKPAILERHGVRYGFLQRTSVYWPTNHEAGQKSAGVAVIKGHTAYQLPLHKTRPEIPPCNRPGLPPVILTWADPEYLGWFKDDVAALRKQCDVLVASCHWGLHEEVLQYMTEIAHAAIDAGADAVLGHGPHFSLPMEAYRGKPIFYGLGNFSFHTGHGGRKHGDWVGMLARLTFEKHGFERASFRFVRHNERNETLLPALKDETEMLARITERSARFGARIAAEGDEAVLQLGKLSD